jgi:hypothetical protein
VGSLLGRSFLARRILGVALAAGTARATGTTGLAGAAGATGLAFATGATWATGLAGAASATGLALAARATRSTGATGLASAAGLVLAARATGAAWTTWLASTAGTTGLVLATGAAWTTGLASAASATGLVLATSATRSTGLAGLTVRGLLATLAIGVLCWILCADRGRSRRERRHGETACEECRRDDGEVLAVHVDGLPFVPADLPCSPGGDGNSCGHRPVGGIGMILRTLAEARRVLCGLPIVMDPAITNAAARGSARRRWMCINRVC